MSEPIQSATAIYSTNLNMSDLCVYYTVRTSRALRCWEERKSVPICHPYHHRAAVTIDTYLQYTATQSHFLQTCYRAQEIGEGELVYIECM